MKRLTLTTLCLIYFFSSVVFAHAMESNFWAERRKSLDSAHSNEEPTQVASLPAGFQSSQSLLNQLPSVGSALPGGSAVMGSPAWKGLCKNKSAALPASLKSLVDSIPLMDGSIQEIYDAKNSNQPPLLLIQDVHLNSEAQTNIAGILQELIDQRQIGAVGVEGAFENFDFTHFREFPNKTIVKEVSDDYLNKKLLAAPSYVGITSPAEPPPFVGIDDKEHYDLNVAGYLDSLKVKKEVLKKIASAELALAESKQKIFSPELKKFDDLRTRYAKGELGFGEYVYSLNGVIAKEPEGRLKQSVVQIFEPGHQKLQRQIASVAENRSLAMTFVVDQFLEAYQLEKSLDFKKVEAARRVVLEKLTKVLKGNELSELLSQSLAYRMGRLSFGDYYQGFKNLCASHGVSLRATPAFDNYIRYVLLSDGIKADQLFDAVNSLENSIVDTLAQSPEEKALVAESDHLALTSKLVEFSMTPKEWEKYKEFGFLPLSHKGEARRGIDRNFPNKEDPIHPLLASPLYDVGRNSLDPQSLRPFEQFYAQADIRSQKMVGRLLSIKDSSPLVMVTGGFHTPQIAQLLRTQKISYVIVSPKITKVDTAAGSSYLSIFAQEKTPLDQLFAGEKLFINPPDVNITHKPLALNLIATLLLAGAGIIAGVQQLEPGWFKISLFAGTAFFVGLAVKNGYERKASLSDQGVICVERPTFFARWSKRATGLAALLAVMAPALGSAAQVHAEMTIEEAKKFFAAGGLGGIFHITQATPISQILAHPAVLAFGILLVINGVLLGTALKKGKTVPWYDVKKNVLLRPLVENAVLFGLFNIAVRYLIPVGGLTLAQGWWFSAHNLTICLYVTTVFAMVFLHLWKTRKHGWHWQSVPAWAALFSLFNAVIYKATAHPWLAFLIIFLMHGPAWNLLILHLRDFFGFTSRWLPLASIGSSDSTVSLTHAPITLQEFKAHAMMIKQDRTKLPAEFRRAQRWLREDWEKINAGLLRFFKLDNDEALAELKKYLEEVRQLSGKDAVASDDMDKILHQYREIYDRAFDLAAKKGNIGPSHAVDPALQAAYKDFVEASTHFTRVMFQFGRFLDTDPDDPLPGLVSERVSLTSMLNSVLSEGTNRLLRYVRVEIGVDAASDPLIIECDDISMEHALTELVKNSAQATVRQVGGQWQSVHDNVSRIKVVARKNDRGDRDIIRITDNGIGMSPEMLANLNTWGLSMPRSDRGVAFGDVGAGVKMARQIIEDHGGTLSFESTPDRGTTATIEIPIRLPSSQAQADIPRLSEPPQDTDIGIASDHLGLVSLEAINQFHEAGDFANVIEQVAGELAAELEIPTIEKYQAPVAPYDQFYNFRKVLRQHVKPNSSGIVEIATKKGTILRLEKDGMLVIIDSRFKKDHAGRGQYASYARTPAKAEHEMAELRAWAHYAVHELKIITWEEIIQGNDWGLLGFRLRDWINGRGEFQASRKEREDRRTKAMENTDRFHQVGLEAEYQLTLGPEILSAVKDLSEKTLESTPLTDDSVIVNVGEARMNLSYYLSHLVGIGPRRSLPIGEASLKAISDLRDPASRLIFVSLKGQLYCFDSKSKRWSHAIPFTPGKMIGSGIMQNDPVVGGYIERTILHHFGNTADQEGIIARYIAQGQATRYSAQDGGVLGFSPLEFRLPKTDSATWGQLPLDRINEGPTNSNRFSVLYERGNLRNRLFFVSTPRTVYIFNEYGLLAAYAKDEKYKEEARRNIFVDTLLQSLLNQRPEWIQDGLGALSRGEPNGNFSLGGTHGASFTLYRLARLFLEYAGQVVTFGWAPVARIKNESGQIVTEFYRVGKNMFVMSGVGNPHNESEPLYVLYGDYFYLPHLALTKDKQKFIVSGPLKEAFSEVGLAIAGPSGELGEKPASPSKYKTLPIEKEMTVLLNGKPTRRKIIFIVQEKSKWEREAERIKNSGQTDPQELDFIIASDDNAGAKDQRPAASIPYLGEITSEGHKPTVAWTQEDLLNWLKNQILRKEGPSKWSELKAQTAFSETIGAILATLNSSDTELKKRRGIIESLLKDLKFPRPGKLAYDMTNPTLSPSTAPIIHLIRSSKEQWGVTSVEEVPADPDIVIPDEMANHPLDATSIRGVMRDPDVAVPGHDPFLTDADIQILARHLVDRFGFLFTDGLTFARAHFPNPQNLNFIIAANVVVKVNAHSRRLQLMPEIVMADKPQTQTAAYLTQLNLQLYPSLRSSYGPGVILDFEELARLAHWPSQLIAILRLCVEKTKQRNNPPASVEIAQDMMRTLFFHEIGESIFMALPASMKNAWVELLQTQGSRPRPGIILFRGQTKSVFQSYFNSNEGRKGQSGLEEWPETEIFADVYALVHFNDDKANVFRRFGETVPDSWRTFMAEVDRYLIVKHEQGRNVWEIDDADFRGIKIRPTTGTGFGSKGNIDKIFPQSPSNTADILQDTGIKAKFQKRLGSKLGAVSYYGFVAFWEAVFQSPTLIGWIGGFWAWVAAGLILMSAFFFGKAHRGRSPPEQRFLMLVGLGLSALTLYPSLVWGASTTTIIAGFLLNMIAHFLYNALILLSRKYPKTFPTLNRWFRRLPLASIGQEPSSRREKNWIRDLWRDPKRTEGAPIHEFLTALFDGADILSVENIDTYPDGSTKLDNGMFVKRLTLPAITGWKPLFNGMETIQLQLGKRLRDDNYQVPTQLDFLYNASGELLSIHPAGKKEGISLSVYYLKLPTSQELKEMSRSFSEVPSDWKHQMEEHAQRQACIFRYQNYEQITQRRMPIPKNDFGTGLIVAKVSVERQSHSFQKFDGDLVRVLANMTSEPDAAWVIMPILPTVYSPEQNHSADLTYFKTLLGGFPDVFKVDPRPNSKGLIVGGGSGWEGVCAAIQTKGDIWMTDINPFSVVNARILARLAGVDNQLRVVHLDNIADEAGNPVFRQTKDGRIVLNPEEGPAAQFDYVIWDMPAISGYKKGHEIGRPSLMWWDGVPAEVFVRFFKGLAQSLKAPQSAKDPGGAGLFWNVSREHPKYREYLSLLASGGQHHRPPLGQTLYKWAKGPTQVFKFQPINHFTRSSAVSIMVVRHKKFKKSPDSIDQWLESISRLQGFPAILRNGLIKGSFQQFVQQSGRMPLLLTDPRDPDHGVFIRHFFNKFDPANASFEARRLGDLYDKFAGVLDGINRRMTERTPVPAQERPLRLLFVYDGKNDEAIRLAPSPRSPGRFVIALNLDVLMDPSYDTGSVDALTKEIERLLTEHGTNSPVGPQNQPPTPPRAARATEQMLEVFRELNGKVVGNRNQTCTMNIRMTPAGRPTDRTLIYGHDLVNTTTIVVEFIHPQLGNIGRSIFFVSPVEPSILFSGGTRIRKGHEGSGLRKGLLRLLKSRLPDQTVMWSDINHNLTLLQIGRILLTKPVFTPSLRGALRRLVERYQFAFTELARGVMLRDFLTNNVASGDDDNGVLKDIIYTAYKDPANHLTAAELATTVVGGLGAEFGDQQKILPTLTKNRKGSGNTTIEHIIKKRTALAAANPSRTADILQDVAWAKRVKMNLQNSRLGRVGGSLVYYFGVATWEAVFQAPALVGFIGGPTAWIAAGFLVIAASIAFGKLHLGRAPPKQKFLMAFAIVLSLLTVAPSLVWGFHLNTVIEGVLLNIITHQFYDVILDAARPYLLYFLRQQGVFGRMLARALRWLPKASILDQATHSREGVIDVWIESLKKFDQAPESMRKKLVAMSLQKFLNDSGVMPFVLFDPLDPDHGNSVRNFMEQISIDHLRSDLVRLFQIYDKYSQLMMDLNSRIERGYPFLSGGKPTHLLFVRDGISGGPMRYAASNYYPDRNVVALNIDYLMNPENDIFGIESFTHEMGHSWVNRYLDRRNLSINLEEDEELYANWAAAHVLTQEELRRFIETQVAVRLKMAQPPMSHPATVHTIAYLHAFAMENSISTDEISKLGRAADHLVLQYQELYRRLQWKKSELGVIPRLLLLPMIVFLWLGLGGATMSRGAETTNKHFSVLDTMYAPLLRDDYGMRNYLHYFASSAEDLKDFREHIQALSTNRPPIEIKTTMGNIPFVMRAENGVVQYWGGENSYGSLTEEEAFQLVLKTREKEIAKSDAEALALDRAEKKQKEIAKQAEKNFSSIFLTLMGFVISFMLIFRKPSNKTTDEKTPSPLVKNSSGQKGKRMAGILWMGILTCVSLGFAAPMPNKTTDQPHPVNLPAIKQYSDISGNKYFQIDELKLPAAFDDSKLSGWPFSYAEFLKKVQEWAEKRKNGSLNDEKEPTIYWKVTPTTRNDAIFIFSSYKGRPIFWNGAAHGTSEAAGISYLLEAIMSLNTNKMGLVMEDGVGSPIKTANFLPIENNLLLKKAGERNIDVVTTPNNASGSVLSALIKNSPPEKREEIISVAFWDVFSSIIAEEKISASPDEKLLNYLRTNFDINSKEAAATIEPYQKAFNKALHSMSYELQLPIKELATIALRTIETWGEDEPTADRLNRQWGDQLRVSNRQVQQIILSQVSQKEVLIVLTGSGHTGLTPVPWTYFKDNLPFLKTDSETVRHYKFIDLIDDSDKTRPPVNDVPGEAVNSGASNPNSADHDNSTQFHLPGGAVLLAIGGISGSRLFIVAGLLALSWLMIQKRIKQRMFSKVTFVDTDGTTVELRKEAFKILESLGPLSPKDRETVVRAIEVSFEAHKNDVRKFNLDHVMPYMRHVVGAVKFLVNDFGVKDPNTVAVMFLHDVKEDHPNIWERRKGLFNDTVQRGVNTLTKVWRKDLPKLQEDRIYLHRVFEENTPEEILLAKLSDVVNNRRGLLHNLKEQAESPTGQLPEVLQFAAEQFHATRGILLPLVNRSKLSPVAKGTFYRALLAVGIGSLGLIPELKKADSSLAASLESEITQLIDEILRTAAEPKDILHYLLPQVKEQDALVFLARQLNAQGRKDAAAVQLQKVYRLSHDLKFVLDRLNYLNRLPDQHRRYSQLIDRLDNAVGLAPVLTWESIPQELVLNRLLPKATIPEHIGFLLELLAENPAYINNENIRLDQGEVGPIVDARYEFWQKNGVDSHEAHPISKINGFFKGGGASGLAYIGALEELEKNNVGFKKVAGTSIGAAVASFIAAGFTVAEIKNLFMKTDFSQFKDRRWGFMPPILNMILFGGRYRGDAIEKWINDQIKTKLGLDHDPLMKELPLPLTVIVSNLSNPGILELRSDDYPDLKVAQAVRDSMGLPFFFEPRHWNGDRVGDGGVIPGGNYRLSVFEEEQKRGETAVGFFLVGAPAPSERPFKFMGAFGNSIIGALRWNPFLELVFLSLYSNLRAVGTQHVDDRHWERTIKIQIPQGLHQTKFELTDDERDALIKAGSVGVKESYPKVMRAQTAVKASVSGETDKAVNPASDQEKINGFFKGGGAGGFAYVGVLEELEKNKVGFKQAAGTSIGAVVASFIAAGFSAGEIKELFMNTDFDQFKDRRWGFMPPMLNMILFGGRYRGDAIEKWINDQIKAKLKLDHDPLMGELLMPLTVIVSNLSNSKSVEVRSGDHPELKVASVVRHSLGLPFFFEPRHWKGDRVGDGGLIPGGIYRLSVFNKEKTGGEKVVGFFLMKELPPSDRLLEFVGPFGNVVLSMMRRSPFLEQILLILNSTLNAIETQHVDDKDWARSVKIILPSNLPPTKFNLTAEERSALKAAGEEGVRKSYPKAMRAQTAAKGPILGATGKSANPSSIVDHLFTIVVYGVSKAIGRPIDAKKFSAHPVVKAVGILAAGAEASLLIYFTIDNSLGIAGRLALFGIFFAVDYLLGWAANHIRGEPQPAIYRQAFVATFYLAASLFGVQSLTPLLAAGVFHVLSDAQIISRRVSSTSDQRDRRFIRIASFVFALGVSLLVRMHFLSGGQGYIDEVFYTIARFVGRPGGDAHLFPFLSYWADQWQGLWGVRFLSALFGMATTGFVFKVSEQISKNWVSRDRATKAALIASLVFAFSGPALFISNLGTYDSLAAMFFSFGLWQLSLRNQNNKHIFFGAFGLVLAGVSRYGLFLYLPFALLLPFFQKSRGEFKLRSLFGTAAGLLLIYYLFTPDLISSMMTSHSIGLTISQGKGLWDVLWMTIFHIYPALILGTLAYLMLRLKTSAENKVSQIRHQRTLLSYFITGFLVFIVYHSLSGITLALEKNLALSLIFLAVIAGLGVESLLKRLGKTERGSFLGLVLSFVLLSGILIQGNYQSQLNRRLWPTYAATMQAVQSQVGADTKEIWVLNDYLMPLLLKEFDPRTGPHLVSAHVEESSPWKDSDPSVILRMAFERRVPLVIGSLNDGVKRRVGQNFEGIYEVVQVIPEMSGSKEFSIYIFRLINPSAAASQGSTIDKAGGDKNLSTQTKEKPGDQTNNDEPLAMQKGAEQLAHILNALADHRTADAMGEIQNVANLDIGHPRSTTMTPFLQKWDQWSKNPEFIAMIRTQLGDRIKPNSLQQNDLLALVLRSVGFSDDGIKDLVSAPLADQPRVYIMKDQEEPALVIAALMKSGLGKPTTLFVKKEDAQHYQAIADLLNKYVPQDQKQIQVKIYTNEREVGLDQNSVFRPQDVTVKLPQDKVLFILSSKIKFYGDGKKEGVIPWEQLLPPADRRHLNEIMRILNQILVAA